MPRRPQRPPIEAAVSSSPLFSLPAELRNMIYGHLLSREDPVFITGDQFSRHPSPNSYSYCDQYYFGKPRLVPFCHCWNMVSGSRADASSLSPSILRTCRFVNAEASPFLYHFNDIIFKEPIAAKRFSVYVDQKQVAQLEKIHLCFKYRHLPLWTSYFITGSKDFPNLKRIHLSNWANFDTLPCQMRISFLIALVKCFNSVETIVFDEIYGPLPLKMHVAPILNMHVAPLEALKKIKNAIKIMRIFKVPTRLVKSENDSLDYSSAAPGMLLHQVLEDGVWRNSAFPN